MCACINSEARKKRKQLQMNHGNGKQWSPVHSSGRCWLLLLPSAELGPKQDHLHGEFGPKQISDDEGEFLSSSIDLISALPSFIYLKDVLAGAEVQ